MFINTDIKAVKASYFANNGSTFHMSREDPDEYSLYDCTMPIIFVGHSLVLLFLSQVAFPEHSQSLESAVFFAIKKQKEKSLNPRNFLDVQDRTQTGCLRSLVRFVPDPPQAQSVLFLQVILYTQQTPNQICAASIVV